jgi:hypothetical protein
MTSKSEADSLTACLLCPNARIALLPSIMVNVSEATETASMVIAIKSKVEGTSPGHVLTYSLGVISRNSYDITVINT